MLRSNKNLQDVILPNAEEHFVSPAFPPVADLMTSAAKSHYYVQSFKKKVNAVVFCTLSDNWNALMLLELLILTPKCPRCF